MSKSHLIDYRITRGFPLVAYSAVALSHTMHVSKRPRQCRYEQCIHFYLTFPRQKSYTIHPEFGHSYGSQLTDYNYAALPYHFKLQHHVYPLTIIPSAIPPVDP
jgi:hypothetical protein